MIPEYWKRQAPDEPLFPDILWEKPVRRDLAGKLLIVGGSEQGIHDPALAYEVAKEAGVGEIRVAVPESLKPLARSISGVDLMPATPSGTLSNKGREHLLFAAHWADGVLLAGNFGRNSETSLLLSALVREWRGILAVTKDALEALSGEFNELFARHESLLVMNLAQLQRATREIGFPKAFQSDSDLLHFVELLHELTLNTNAAVITRHHDQLVASFGGEVVSTERKDLSQLWCVEITSRAASMLLHNRGKVMPAIATSLVL